MHPTEVVFTVISLLLALAWHVVAIFFWRSWKHRRSPLSLAICALTGYPIFTNASSVIFLHQDQLTTVILLVSANLLVLINFVVCFKWQKERFGELRSRKVKSTPDSHKEAPKDERRYTNGSSNHY